MTTQKAVFANGCFWCTEAVFSNLKGVFSVKPGYTGGNVKNPTYREVSTGKTGHAEAIEIIFDPQEIEFGDLLTVFFATHDPTTLNRQGADVGTQYRSAIFYTTEEQKNEAAAFIERLNKKGPRVVTELVALDDFYPAEEYHQKYYESNTDAPYCRLVISPKLAMLNERFSELLKKVARENGTGEHNQ